MVFVKMVKNKSYFMRFQTKFKRRRQGKTDYYARKRLIIQDKDKYNTPKYRLVARITSKRVIAQIVSATIHGDRVFCQADSTEFRKWGLTTGLANYPSAYATGLLLSRRLLQKVKLDTLYEENTKKGTPYDVSKNQKEKRPFKAILDVGLRATKTGSKVFAVMKGAADGGLHIPHSEKRLPGQAEDGENGENKILRKRIFGVHIDEYMALLKGNDKGNLQFSQWNTVLQATKAGSVAKLYEKIHSQIRKSPTFTKKEAKKGVSREAQKKLKRVRLTREQRKENLKKKIEIRLSQLKKQKK